MVARTGKVHNGSKFLRQLRIALTDYIDSFRDCAGDLIEPRAKECVSFNLLYPVSLRLPPKFIRRINCFLGLSNVKVYELLGLSLREAPLFEHRTRFFGDFFVEDKAFRDVESSISFWCSLSRRSCVGDGLSVLIE